MWVREVMTRLPVTVSPETTTKAALQVLDRHGITSMPVLDGSGNLVGLVSEADLVRDVVAEDSRSHLAPRPAPVDLAPRTVGEAMTRQVVTVRPDTDLHEAVELMTSTAVKSLPVVDRRRRCVGILSRRDVVRLLARDDADLAREVAALFVSIEHDWLVEAEEGVVTVAGPRDVSEVALAESLARTVPGVLRVVVRPGVG